MTEMDFTIFDPAGQVGDPGALAQTKQHVYRSWQRNWQMWVVEPPPFDIVSFSKGAAFGDRELSLKLSLQKANP